MKELASSSHRTLTRWRCRAARAPTGRAARRVDVPRLVVEVEVRLELAQERALVEAAEEHRLVDRDVPVHQRADRALVRGRAARGDERGAELHRHRVRSSALCSRCSASSSGLNGPGGSGRVRVVGLVRLEGVEPVAAGRRARLRRRTAPRRRRTRCAPRRHAARRLRRFADTRARPGTARRARAARPRRSPTGTGSPSAARGSGTGLRPRVNTPRSMPQRRAACTERNTRRPETGSLLRQDHDLDALHAVGVERRSFCTSGNATPGFAGTSSRSSCSSMYAPVVRRLEDRFSSSKSNSAREQIATTSWLGDVEADMQSSIRAGSWRAALAPCRQGARCGGLCAATSACATGPGACRRRAWLRDALAALLDVAQRPRGSRPPPSRAPRARW